MIELANNEARYIGIVHRQIMKMLERELTPLELGPGSYLYLFGLYIRDNRKQQELADVIGTDKAATTRALARLEDAGYIQRQADTKDQRATRVLLTAKGRKLRPTLEAALISCTLSFTGVLDSSEQKEFQRLLAKVAAPLITRA